MKSIRGQSESEPRSALGRLHRRGESNPGIINKHDYTTNGTKASGRTTNRCLGLSPM